MDNAAHQVVVVGGGFGGLRVVDGLRRAPVEVTLVDRRNFHLFQPLTYQVATGALSPGEIAYPLRAIFKRAPNVNVLLADVRDFDLAARELVLDAVSDVPVPERLGYDSLVVGGGSHYAYFGHDDWRAYAVEVKSIESALEARSRLLAAFEAAEAAPDEEDREAWLTFVVVGAGPTGVEMAGQIAELARDTLRRNFRRIDPRGGPDRPRRGGRPRAHDVSALPVREGRALAPAARRDRPHRPHGRGHRRGGRDARGR